MPSLPTLTAAQLRAARAMLCLSRLELARRAGVGFITVKRMEISVTPLARTTPTVGRVAAALEVAGACFVPRGVLLRELDPRTDP